MNPGMQDRPGDLPEDLKMLRRTSLVIVRDLPQPGAQLALSPEIAQLLIGCQKCLTCHIIGLGLIKPQGFAAEKNQLLVLIDEPGECSLVSAAELSEPVASLSRTYPVCHYVPHSAS